MGTGSFLQEYLATAMQTLLFIINDAPYGSERLFNALRLAINLYEQDVDSVSIRLFMLSDAVTAALAGQQPAEGYNIRQMLEILLAQGAQISLCKTCVEARGLSSLATIDGISIGTLNQLSGWTLAADKVLTF